MINLQEKIIGHVEAATRAQYATVPVDPVHPIEHTERVVVNTLRICRGDDISLLKPVLAAWLHDYGRPAEYMARQTGTKIYHAEESARQVPIILRPFRKSVGEAAISEIQTAVAVHSRLNSEDDSSTAMILKDADRLDGLGSVGLYRTITAKQGSPIYDDSRNEFPDEGIAQDRVISQEITLAESMLYTIEWFNMLRMPTAIEMGSYRVQKQIDFLEGLVEELGLSGNLLKRNEILCEARRKIHQVIPSINTFRTL